jgi:hypothetical protein
MATNGTTAIDLVDVTPDVTTQRKIETISIFNRDAGSILVTVLFYDNATTRIWWQGYIPTGGALRYSPESQWQVTIEAAIVPNVEYGLWAKDVSLWKPTTATAGLWINTVGAGAGTFNNTLPTTTNQYTAHKRARYSNVVTTLNQVLGQRNTEAIFFRGNSTGQGGFYFFACCGFDTWTNGGRFFAGLHSATTVVSAEPSALNNTCGFCIDSGDAGAIFFLTRDGTTATKAPTGLTAVTNRGYCVEMFAAPAGANIFWRITDMVSGAVASGTAVATLPVNTTLLTAGVLASNAALTAANAIQLGVQRIYLEI